MQDIQFLFWFWVLHSEYCYIAHLIHCFEDYCTVFQILLQKVLLKILLLLNHLNPPTVKRKRNFVESKCYSTGKYLTPSFVKLCQIPSAFSGFVPPLLLSLGAFSHCFSSCVRVQAGTVIWHIADNILTY